MFYWDDTALIGTAEALATAARVIWELASETVLELRWRKCHLYGTESTMSRCRQTNNPPFPAALTLHHDLNIEYLKAPIGSDEFVNDCMRTKLEELHETIQAVSAMEWKHEAATLLKHCGTFCRVVHLMRTVPPHQIEAFIKEFDTTIRSAYEDLLGTKMGDHVWKIAKLPPKYGGMGWRTGIQTYGAQYITSIAKTADDVERIVPGYNPAETVTRNANKWLLDHAGPSFDAATALRTIRTNKVPKWPSQGTGHRLSLAQKCEEWLWFDIRKGLNEDELMHALAHSGPGHRWVTAPSAVQLLEHDPTRMDSKHPQTTWP